MSALYVSDGWMGQLIEGMTTNITGDPFMTYFFLFIIIVLLFLVVFKLDVEWVMLSVTGIVLTLLAYSGEWLPFFGLIAIFFAVIVARYWTSSN